MCVCVASGQCVHSIRAYNSLSLSLSLCLHLYSCVRQCVRCVLTIVVGTLSVCMCVIVSVSVSVSVSVYVSISVSVSGCVCVCGGWKMSGAIVYVCVCDI